jgi:hypothetical protein
MMAAHKFAVGQKVRFSPDTGSGRCRSEPKLVDLARCNAANGAAELIDV